jgi:sec-independent protein translocase protein TatC
MEEQMTFWDHLDVLRGSIIRVLVAAVVMGLGVFFLKDYLFDLVLWPRDSDFPTYRLLGAEPFQLKLINTELTEQFMIHMKVSLVMGLLVASPYIIYILFRFISPALYENERRASLRLVGAAYSMFIIGIIVNYFLIFPLTVRFLGTYSVSTEVETMLTLSSYVDTLLLMSLVFGIVFEIPVISWLLARFGMLKASWMSEYRRHAIVAILIMAAIITPTADIMTLIIVSLPIWMLYEISIWIVKLTIKDSSESEEADEETDGNESPEFAEAEAEDLDSMVPPELAEAEEISDAEEIVDAEEIN